MTPDTFDTPLREQFPDYHALSDDGAITVWSRFHGW
jgi:hypothetical protein